MAFVRNSSASACPFRSPGSCSATHMLARSVALLGRQRTQRKRAACSAVRACMGDRDGLMREPLELEGRTDGAGQPWGLWATVGLGLLVVALWNVAQVTAVVLIAGRRVNAGDVMAQGWMVAWATIVSAPVAVGAVALLARLRKGVSVAAYLGLAWPHARQAVRWSLILLGFIAASDLLSWALGRPLVPDPVMVMFRTAGSLPIFLIGLVVAAPLAEEFLFRGFLFPGLLRSRLGATGAIGVTALAWGSLHVQYDLYGMASVAAGGILLGWVRWRTGSLWLCVLLHALVTIVATVEVMLIVAAG